METLSNANILKFSDEILLQIISNINTEDIINLSQVCSRLDRLLQDRSICVKSEIHWNVKILRIGLVKFLQDPFRASYIVHLILNDIYWVPSGVIRSIVLKLTSLQELDVAGSQLSWNHLSQIFAHPLSRLLSLSWTWDDQLEELIRKRKSMSSSSFGDANLSSDTAWTELLELREKFQLLRSLVVHIPEIFNTNRLIISSHRALCYLISLCTNLEQLWIFSWPKTTTERKLSSNFMTEEYYPLVKFPHLHTFVFSAHESPKIFIPRLTTILINSFQNEVKDFRQLKTLWVDHPFLDVVYRQENRYHSTWPIMDLSSLESFCLPLVDEVLNHFDASKLQNCRHLLVTHGSSRFTSLNKLLGSIANLESFASKAFNIRIDWGQFVNNHPNLKAIRVTDDAMISSYADACVAMGKLARLTKVSLPIYSLFEIKSQDAVVEYTKRVTNTTHEIGKNSELSEQSVHLSSEYFCEPHMKRKRIGLPSGVAVSQSKRRSISGLDYLTLFCPKVDEFELGFTEREIGGVKLVLESLISISRWTHLKKLTLDSIPITNGDCLVQIAKSCRLESIRLSDLGPSAKCIYVNALCSALKLCSNLKDFRLQQKYIGSTAPLFQSLENCVKLERMMLVSHKNDRPLEEQGLLKVMSTCSRLSVIYLIVDSTTKASCFAMRKGLESRYRETRPALSVVIRNDLGNEEEDAKFPSVHYRQLVIFGPQVCSFTQFPRIVL